MCIRVSICGHLGQLDTAAACASETEKVLGSHLWPMYVTPGVVFPLLCFPRLSITHQFPVSELNTHLLKARTDMATK